MHYCSNLKRVCCTACNIIRVGCLVTYTQHIRAFFFFFFKKLYMPKEKNHVYITWFGTHINAAEPKKRFLVFSLKLKLFFCSSYINKGSVYCEDLRKWKCNIFFFRKRMCYTLSYKECIYIIIYCRRLLCILFVDVGTMYTYMHNEI